MKRIVEFPLENGDSIFVEVDEPAIDDRIGLRDEIVEKANQTFESTLDKIKPVANVILTKVRNLHQPADEVEVKFGIKISAELGAVFGSETEQAVIRFQQFYGIRADGVVGTRIETIRISLDDQNQNQYGGGDSLPNALNLGDRGSQVRELQESLRQLRYYTPNPSGYFGPTTRDAVARFQQDYRIKPNGIADARTLITISNALQGSNQSQTSGCNTAIGDICPGERSQRSVLQQRLQEWGFFNGIVTGYFGSATSDAVAQFQRYYRINPTGFVNNETLLALQLGNFGHPTGENQDTTPKTTTPQ